MKPGRNPRRAYEADGREIEPPTVGSEMAKGFRTVTAFCEAAGCGRNAPVELAAFPPSLPIPDIALRLRCTACGDRRGIKIHINVNELYAKSWGGEGYHGNRTSDR
jgi:hypothetical protein